MTHTPEPFTSEPAHTRARRLSYSIAAGAAAAATATGADADVIQFVGPGIEIAQFSSQALNIDGDAYNDILLKNYVFLGGNYQGATVIYAPGRMVSFSSGFYYANALSEGDVVDATTVGDGFAVSLAYGGNNPNAEFNNTDDAFIGLSFPIGGNTPDVLHYGWVRVAIDNDAGTFKILEWAYETEPGVGLTIQTTIPEPTTLGLLAAGAAGVAALRRGRRG